MHCSIRRFLFAFRIVPALCFISGLALSLEAVAAPLPDAAKVLIDATRSLPVDFPIAVWLQDPGKAERYHAAGINIFVGLWKGPTPEQLSQLEHAGMRVICHQNAAALERMKKPGSPIIAWMHGDEPDNAQEKPGGGYGPPILPEKIVEDYGRIREKDTTLPVLLNLGQAVAWDNYIGRGVRRNHPEDYPKYTRGCDIASFDIYPANHDSPLIQGKLEYVATGVERLVRWNDGKPVWNCIECTQIGDGGRKPTPEEVRSEVWMSLIHGSRGLIYFVHQFKPTFNEGALLADLEMLRAVTAINGRLHQLAPVLNSPNVSEFSVTVSNPAVPVACMMKRVDGATYLFAVGMRNEKVRATFKLNSPTGKSAEVLDESRSVPVAEGEFSDDFAPYAVHLYQLGKT
jgi:hypothetical protein